MMTRIQVKQFAMLADAMPQEKIGLSTSLTYQYAEDAELVACVVSFKFTSDQQPFLILDVQCDFSIHPEDWKSLQADSGIKLTRSLQEILAVHTIGTARGILFCKTEGTVFNRIMIPPINVSKMIEDE